MATDESSDPLARDGAAAAERTAPDLGSIVADKVRAAIESAEQSAEELRRRALSDTAADRDEVHRSAALVLGRIDAIEAQVTRLLDGVRDEVTRIREQADRPQDPPRAPVDPTAGPEHPDGSLPHAEAAVPSEGAGRRRNARLFGRRRQALPQCAVCGHAAEDGEEGLEHWRRVRRMSLCPECQAEGWQIPEGASVPCRSPQGHEPGRASP
jgi:hypothetical protein